MSRLPETSIQGWTLDDQIAFDRAIAAANSTPDTSAIGAYSPSDPNYQSLAETLYQQEEPPQEQFDRGISLTWQSGLNKPVLSPSHVVALIEEHSQPYTPLRRAEADPSLLDDLYHAHTPAPASAPTAEIEMRKFIKAGPVPEPNENWDNFMPGEYTRVRHRMYERKFAQLRGKIGRAIGKVVAFTTVTVGTSAVATGTFMIVDGVLNRHAS